MYDFVHYEKKRHTNKRLRNVHCGDGSANAERLAAFFHGLSQQTQNISLTFIQCWANVEDVGPTLYKCYTNVLCLLGYARVTLLAKV